MYRFFIKEEQIHDGMIEICGSDVNHIKNVLRMKTGDKVYLPFPNSRFDIAFCLQFSCSAN